MIIICPIKHTNAQHQPRFEDLKHAHISSFFSFCFFETGSVIVGRGREKKKKWGKKCEARTRTHTHGMCKKSAQCRLVYTHIHTGVLSHPLRMKGDQRVKLAPLSQVRPLEAVSAQGSLASSPGSSRCRHFTGALLTKERS